MWLFLASVLKCLHLNPSLHFSRGARDEEDLVAEDEEEDEDEEGLVEEEEEDEDEEEEDEVGAGLVEEEDFLASSLFPQPKKLKNLVINSGDSEEGEGEELEGSAV